MATRYIRARFWLQDTLAGLGLRCCDPIASATLTRRCGGQMQGASDGGYELLILTASLAQQR